MKFHHFLPRNIITKYTATLASLIAIVGMVIIVAASLAYANSTFRKTHGLEVSQDEASNAQLISASDTNSPSSSDNDSSATVTLPQIVLTSDKVTAQVGDTVTLTWEATAMPDNESMKCFASDDWSSDKSARGSEAITISAAKTYFFTLTCSTAKGTNFATATLISASSQGQPTVSGTGDVSKRPHVSFSANPTALQVGGSATLQWTVTDSPTSCSASGAWSGSKGASGSQSTGAFGTTGTRTYTLTCSNSAGSETASIAIVVSATPPKVIAPVVSLSVSPSSLTAGSSATISWSVSNGPTSCSASGAWSGSKGASGSQSTGALGAGSYTFTLTCVNTAGSASKSAGLSVAPAPVYCSGRTPCYGRSDLAAHATTSSCWGWNQDWVINITSYQPHHPRAKSSTASSDLANASATCNHNIVAYLNGSAAIPGYKTSEGKTQHGHKSVTVTNGSGTELAPYRVGYYDANKP